MDTIKSLCLLEFAPFFFQRFTGIYPVVKICGRTKESLYQRVSLINRSVYFELPFNITYVDENNHVKFFSTPEKRIFRRTNSIIGRDVKNCHPHESVHVVEQIVDAFRKGEKDKASFWIQMKGEFILIQYFAVRDEKGNYKGVVEVSQEITEIRNIQGEKRLLDWTH